MTFVNNFLILNHFLTLRVGKFTHPQGKEVTDIQRVTDAEKESV